MMGMSLGSDVMSQFNGEWYNTPQLLVFWVRELFTCASDAKTKICE